MLLWLFHVIYVMVVSLVSKVRFCAFELVCCIGVPRGEDNCGDDDLVFIA